jgi:glutamine synthetase
MDAISEWLEQRGIAEVEVLVPDLIGNARGKFIPTAQYLHGGLPRLPESILAQSVTGQYSAEHWDFVEPTDADMVLKPDASTLRPVPWARKPTAQIVHDCYTMDDRPHPLSTRNVLQRVLALYEAEGWRPVIAPEMEFYLLKRNVDSSEPLEPPVGRSGRAETAPQSYSIDAVAEFDGFVEELYAHTSAQSLAADTLIHENGAAQMEINFMHGNPLALADQVFAFKRTVRETALRHGIYATFMAKPMQHEPGSAMHIHQSIVRVDDGSNIFVDDDGQQSPALRAYIAGLQRFTPDLISLYAPNVNSYRRLAPDISAPTNFDWGYDNRMAAFRVPHSSAEATRVENRFPGADANPYLAIAATLASGYLGMKLGLSASEPLLGAGDEETVKVARTLEEGLRDLLKTPEIVEIFGELFLQAYSAVKLTEFEEFNRIVSSWEREHLLLNV